MNKKQSLFHIAKRDTLPWYKSFAIRGCAILLALVVCAVVTMLLTGENPVNIFATIFKGAFGSARKSWVTGGPAGHFSGGDARLQNALLEHRRRGSGAHWLSGHGCLHDLSG